jgi:hypothetical protein
MLAGLVALLWATAAFADAVPRFEPVGEKPQGLWLPTVGRGNGQWELGVGARFWRDELHPRNLIAQGDIDLGPGVRAHILARHNREVDSLRGWRPNLDEAYLEGYGFYTRPHSGLSASLRVGRVRYLRFPYPDAIAVFDQVPGVADLQGRFDTGYSGAVLAAEYAHDSGLGAHFTGIAWGFDGARADGDANAIEDYVFLRRDLGSLRLEARAGGIAQRTEPLGGPARKGYDAYLGLDTHAGYILGALYEKREGERAYTGLMIVFPDDRVTRALGGAGFDYTRDPQGFSVQAPVVHGRFGLARQSSPNLGEPVGEVVAVRTRTYWQAGLIRNFYEHRISAWGETSGAGLTVTAQEYPYYLWAEALVSPHTKADSQWFHDRQGPAHNSRLVIYRFYRPAEGGLPQSTQWTQRGTI